MMEMHSQEMAAMKADIEKVKSSLAEMKANIFTIREPNELARWDTVLAHMEHMQKHMEAMGPGMMRGPGVMMHSHDMGGQPASPPPDKKPQ